MYDIELGFELPWFEGLVPQYCEGFQEPKGQ